MKVIQPTEPSLMTLDCKSPLCERLHPEIDVLELLGFFFPQEQNPGHYEFYLEFKKVGKLWGRIAALDVPKDYPEEYTLPPGQYNVITLAKRFNIKVPDAGRHVLIHSLKQGTSLIGSSFLTSTFYPALTEAVRAFTKERVDLGLASVLVSA